MADGSAKGTRMATVKSDKAQIEKFKQAARELDCDDSNEQFETSLKKLVKTAPKHAGGLK